MDSHRNGAGAPMAAERTPGMLDRTNEPIEYQSWLQTEPDAVSLHLAELIADARA